MRLFLALLFLVFGSPAFAAEGSPMEDLLLSPDQKRSLSEGTPAERREILGVFFQLYDRTAADISNGIDYWYAHLPKRGVGIQVAPRDVASGSLFPIVVVRVVGALPQASVAEQLCPDDVIRAVDGTSVDPLMVADDADLDTVLDQTRAYLDRVTGLLRNGKGNRVSVTVDRSGTLVELSPKLDVYRRHRGFIDQKVAGMRASIAIETMHVNRLRLVVQNGSDDDVLTTIGEVYIATRRLNESIKKMMPGNFGTPPLCAKKE